MYNECGSIDVLELMGRSSHPEALCHTMSDYAEPRINQSHFNFADLAHEQERQRPDEPHHSDKHTYKPSYYNAINEVRLRKTKNETKGNPRDSASRILISIEHRRNPKRIIQYFAPTALLILRNLRCLDH